MKPVELLLLLPNSLLSRLFAVFDVLKLGIRSIVETENATEFEFGGMKIQASDVSGRMMVPSAANRTRASTIRLPAMHP